MILFRCSQNKDISQTTRIKGHKAKFLKRGSSACVGLQPQKLHKRNIVLAETKSLHVAGFIFKGCYFSFSFIQIII